MTEKSIISLLFIPENEKTKVSGNVEYKGIKLNILLRRCFTQEKSVIKLGN